jgi:stearoyl-CoA desaturase (Delta-9 desaturase)
LQHFQTAELPGYAFNFSTAFIDMFAKIGWATELKTVPDSIIKGRVLRTGDGTHKYSKGSHKQEDNNNEDQDGDSRDVEHFWGFGDKEMTKQDMKNVKILY